MQSVVLDFTVTDNNFCVFSHEFENRVVFVGVGEIQDAFNAVKFNQILQIEILRRLGDPDAIDPPTVVVKIHRQNVSEQEADAHQRFLIGELQPVWQQSFDRIRYDKLPHILCVQSKQVYPTLYAAAKALNMSMTSAYTAAARPVAWRKVKGFQIVRTSRPVTISKQPPPLPIGN